MNLSNENKQILISRMNDLPPDYKTFIEGGFINSASLALKAKHKLDDKTSTAVENEIVLTLLFFTPISEFINNLESIIPDADKRKSINDDFKEALPKNILQFIKGVNERQIAKDEKRNESASQKVHGYGIPKPQEQKESETAYTPASQDDLLGKKQENIPSYSDDNTKSVD